MEHFGDEANIIMIFYVNDATISCTNVIHILSDDSYVFVLLVYRVYWEEMACKVQMDR